MTVMLIGHGGWDVKATPAYAQVPKATTLTFYTENFKSLMEGGAGEVRTLSAVFADAEPNQTVGEFKTSPNYTLYKLEADLLAYVKSMTSDQATAIYVGEDGWPDEVQLCTDTDGTKCGSGNHNCDGLFSDERIRGEVYWMACRNVSLAETAIGKASGVNAAQDTLGYVTGEQQAKIDEFLALGDSDRETHLNNASEEEQHTLALSTEVKSWVLDHGLTLPGSAFS